MTTPHLPRRAPIDAYGAGGFRFAGMSHRGSLLCLRDRHVTVEAMPTGPAVRTYNILLGENRRVAAGLIAVV